MVDLYMGQIMQGGWNFAPAGSHMCDGSLLPIVQYNALYALLGIQFGGNGTSTFAIPNLYGRTIIGAGRSNTGTTYVPGQSSGTENVTLLQTNMPIHTHAAAFNPASASMSGSSTKASMAAPVSGAVIGRSYDTSSTNSTPVIYCPAGTTTDVPLAGLNVSGAIAVQPAGGSQPFSVMQPYVAMTTVITLVGLYPSRN